MGFTIPLADDDPNEIYFEINLHQSWMRFIDSECEEYGMERIDLVRELVKLGMVAWRGQERRELEG